jgi:hypothetical protein
VSNSIITISNGTATGGRSSARSWGEKVAGRAACGSTPSVRRSEPDPSRAPRAALVHEGHGLRTWHVPGLDLFDAKPRVFDEPIDRAIEVAASLCHCEQSAGWVETNDLVGTVGLVREIHAGADAQFENAALGCRQRPLSVGHERRLPHRHVHETRQDPIVVETHPSPLSCPFHRLPHAAGGRIAERMPSTVPTYKISSTPAIERTVPLTVCDQARVPSAAQ